MKVPAVSAVLSTGGAVTTVAFSPDSHLVSAGTNEEYHQRTTGGDGHLGRVYLWSVPTRKLLHRWTVHGPITSVVFSHDAQRVIAASGQAESYGQVQIWDVHSGHLLASHHEPVQVSCLALSPDDKILAIGTNGMPTLLDAWTAQLRRGLVAPTGTPLAASDAHPYSVSALAFGSQRSDELASLCLDGKIRLWNLETGEVRRRWDGPASGGLILRGGNTELVTAGCQIQFWDVARRQHLGTMSSEQDVPARAIAFSTDGKVLASGASNCKYDHPTRLRPWATSEDPVQLWSVKNARLEKLLHGHKGYVSAVSFSPDGQWLATGSADKTVRLWPKRQWTL